MTKETHETQSIDSKVNVDEYKIYSGIEDLQRITGYPPLKRNSFDFKEQPKAIRFIGYFIIGYSVLSFLASIIINFLN